MPPYIAANQEELFAKAPKERQDLILSGDVDAAAKELVTKYKLPEDMIIVASDIISFILIGAINVDDVLQAIQEMLNVTSEVAVHIAEDLEHGILEKAKMSLVSKSKDTVAVLQFQGDATKTELRKEILDTTKRESGLEKDQSRPAPKKPSVITPGSRSQLLEQLQVLGTIPNDEEIASRLSHIQEQISSIKKQEETNALESKIALKSFLFGEKGKEVVTPTVKQATYSVAPTQYNVDPYKEVVD